jgi:hypothetical protein
MDFDRVTLDSDVPLDQREMDIERLRISSQRRREIRRSDL